MSINKVVADILSEVLRATGKYPPFHTCHEGFAVLLEEVDELWDQVKIKQGRRDIDKLYSEAIQVAAMAVRFAHELCDDERGQR